MPVKKSATPPSDGKPDISFPYFLDDDEDQFYHIKHLMSQQAAYEEFHRQVMAFLLPQQVEVSKKFGEWWDRFTKRHNVPKGMKLQLHGRQVIVVSESS